MSWTNSRERMGICIEPRFRNAGREIAETSDETKRSLLAAMGVAAGDELRIRAALEEFGPDGVAAPAPRHAGIAGKMPERPL